MHVSTPSKKVQYSTDSKIESSLQGCTVMADSGKYWLMSINVNLEIVQKYKSRPKKI